MAARPTLTRKRIRGLEETCAALVTAILDEPLNLDMDALMRVPSLDDDDDTEDDDAIVASWRKFKLAAEVFEPALRTPVLRRLYQHELPAVSLWSFFRRERGDVAFMRFLGVPLVVYDALCDHMRPHLDAYDDKVLRRGPRTRLDYFDVVAITLRRLQVYGPKWKEVLELEFGAAATVVWRALQHGKVAILIVLRFLPASAVRYHTVEELDIAWEGLVAQHGAPPWAAKFRDGPLVGQYKWPEIAGIRVGYGLDGTVTPALRPGNQFDEAAVKGVKGHSFNHLIGTSICGLVVDYTSCVAGTFNDSRISVDQLKRLANRVLNPAQSFCVALDNGWRFPVTFPLPEQFAAHRQYVQGKSMWMRPLREGDSSPLGLRGYTEACSTWLTIVRQHGEWLNGGLKSQFPVLVTPVRVDQELELRMDFEIVRFLRCRYFFSRCLTALPTPTLLQCVRLYNLRSRIVGWNQIRTTYLRHSDANFQEQLNCATADEYLRKISERTRELAYELRL